MLKVRGLTKIFGGLRAVDDASLDVAQGSIVALIGPNGAGKTTLFSCIAGFQPVNAGRVELLGQDITGMKANLVVAKGLAYSQRAEAWEHARAVAGQVGMGHMLEQPASALTVAGRKRLELARTLATEPRLLLLDEVMAGLNPSEIVEIIAIIQKIRASGVTVLLIEHVMHAVMSLSEQIYVLSYGKIIAQGAPRDIVSDTAVIEAYLGRGAAQVLAPRQQEASHA